MTVSEIKIAIVDDNNTMRSGLLRALSSLGYDTHSYPDSESYLRNCKKISFDILITDLKLPDIDGITLITKMREEDPFLVSILITGYASVENTVHAIKSGAFDVLGKPFSIDDLKVILEKAVRQVRQNRELEFFKGRRKKDVFYGMIGRAPSMNSIFSLIERIGPRDVTVLITGESGTGKELLAHAIHNISPRRKGAFVPVNCGAIPETLIDSELFGYKKGAFTGAQGNRDGLIRSAQNGTLFLDEVGDLPLSTQLRLLRFLQEKEIRPVGSDETYNVDVRVISATNRDLNELVKQGNFREDLFYRLSVVPIRIPSLSERKEDIPLLVMHFMDKSAQKHGMPMPVIKPDALESLINYDWAGNVRQLENMIERIVLLAQNNTITICDLPSQVRPEGNNCEIKFDQDLTLEEVEKKYIQSILDKVDGNRSTAAKILDISRRTLQRKLKDWGEDS